MRLLVWIVLLALIFAAMVFAVSNAGTVTLSLLPFFASWQAPLYAIVMATFAIGLLIGVFYGWLLGGPARKRARALARENREMAADLAELRSERTHVLRGPGAEDMD